MVKLEFSGICEGCKVADLELDGIDLSDDFSKNVSWEVNCTHKEACERIKRQFIPSDPHKSSESNLYRQMSALDSGAME